MAEMKVFIVFTALILVFSCLVIASQDMEQYKQLNIHLKALAEEAACGSGLMTGETALCSEWQISQTDADSYTEFITDYAAKNNPVFFGGNLSASAIVSGPSVVVTAEFSAKKPIFHILGTDVLTVRRVSEYEWVQEN